MHLRGSCSTKPAWQLLVGLPTSVIDEANFPTVPLNSDVLNLILHVCIYDIDPSSYMPSLPLISETLRCIPLYGLALEDPLTPGKPLHSIIVNKLAIVYPLETFAVLASQGLDSLAVEVSKYLTSIPLHQLTDELCTLMGPVYLRRVVFLHVGRVERLKELLRVVPATHDRTILCGATDQQSIQRAWLDIAARLTWEVAASTPILRLQQAFQPLADSTICPNCKDVSALLTLLALTAPLHMSRVGCAIDNIWSVTARRPHQRCWRSRRQSSPWSLDHMTRHTLIFKLIFHAGD